MESIKSKIIKVRIAIFSSLCLLLIGEKKDGFYCICKERMRKLKTHIIWDWNGTLLNDVPLCVRLIGDLLRSHGLPPLDRERYLEIFDFPISDYYRRAGFDFAKESYESLAKRYMDVYPRAGCWLGPVPGMLPLVEALYRDKKHQIILSASDQSVLKRQLAYSGYSARMFEEVLGLDNFYAVSKVELGKSWIAGSGIKPSQAVFVGDTVHDAETAAAMGCGCILVGWGHQNTARLRTAGVPVVETPEALLKAIMD